MFNDSMFLSDEVSKLHGCPHCSPDTTPAVHTDFAAPAIDAVKLGQGMEHIGLGKATNPKKRGAN